MNKIKIKVLLLLVLPITIFINYIASINSNFIESFYSIRFNKITVQLLSSITNKIPFSLGEIIIYIAVFSAVYYTLDTVIKIFKNIRSIKNIASNFILNLGIIISILYFLFIILWGLNYNRVPLREVIEVKKEKYSVNDLTNLYEHIIKKANTLREEVKEDSNDIMKVNGGYKSAFQRAHKGYDKASNIFPNLRGEYGKPKPILASKFLNYTRITGMYFPFTGEANVNIDTVDISLPATTAHEMAHQRGYANEDEANFIAYITCIMHPDADFQYSGYMLALTYVNNALYKEDYSLLEDLNKKISKDVKKDMKYESEFWEKYEGNIDKLSSEINDKYLKANGVEDGEKSYGRMVDLLLRYYENLI